MKKNNPALEQEEEKMHKDLDGDGEKGESPRHRQKVLGTSNKKALPMMKGKGKRKSSGMCAACMKAGKPSCTH